MDAKLSNIDKERIIIDELKIGTSRDDVAKEFGYSSWKGLDMFMRRRNYRWDNVSELYVKNPDKVEIKEIDQYTMSIKAEQVINRIKENENILEIAEALGFENHRAMADYMTKEGMVWNSEVRNYVIENEPSKGLLDEKSMQSIQVTDLETKAPKIQFQDDSKYRSILDFLYENEEQLKLLLTKNNGEIPKHILPGPAKTKSFYINDKLTSLLSSFATHNNISQREILETSIIHYLQKYGGSYREEVNKLCNRS